jgi:hypothetical protein
MPPRLPYKPNPYEQTTCPVQRVRIDVKLIPRPAFQTVRSCINTPLLTSSQGFGIWTLTGAKHSCSSAHSFEHSIRAFGKAGIASAAQFKSQSGPALNSSAAYPMRFNSAPVCPFGWQCRRLDRQARDPIIPPYLDSQKQMVELARPYFMGALVMPYFRA